MADLKKEQREVIFHNHGNILVSASAGSGKTFTMIERVKRLVLEQKAEVSRILAVTFTEMAALEMKEKLKDALSKKLKEGENALLEQALNEIPVADICTLHSFCGRLIRTYFFEVGLSPDFKIADEADSSILKNECIDKTFREFYDLEEDWFLTLVDRHASGRTDKRFKELVLSAYAFCDSEAHPYSIMDKFRDYYSEKGQDFLLKAYKEFLDKRLRPIKRQAEKLLIAFQDSGLKKAEEFTKSLIADILAVTSSTDVRKVKDFEDYKLRLDFERNLVGLDLQNKIEASELRDKLKKLFARFSKHLSTVKNDYENKKELFEHTDGFVKVIKRFSEIYAEEKREENLLDFNDLEHFALKILQNEEIRQEVKEKYKYVFIDEYQDVNGVQEEIISKIADDNLFMVGDVKQSIYGFRGCRPEIFAQKCERMKATGEKVVRLNDNFRSSNSVINTVNEIFDYSMTKEYFGEDYKGNSDLIDGGVFPEDKTGRAMLHVVRVEKEALESEKPRIYDVLKESEKPYNGKENVTATLVADIINRELTEKYYDVKSQTEKPVTYSDIAILTRNKNTEYVVDLVRNLTWRGIPVTTDATENVCDFPEISMLVSALKLVDCFEQDIPIASTLKSPIGGFKDEQLLEVAKYFYENAGDNKKNGSFCDAFWFYIENADTTLKEKLVKFVEYFDKVRLTSDFIGAQGVLNKLVAENQLESYLFATRLGKTKVSRMRRFIEASVSGGKKLTVKEFLYKVENAPDSFGFSECGDENAVKVMTIHASKGLEFPVVIICGLERAMNDEEESAEILFDRELGFGVKRYDDQERIKEETLLRGVIKERMRERRINEEMRLFYVATTRARYALHMTAVVKEDRRKYLFDGADSFMDYLPPTLESTEYTQTSLSFGQLRKGVRTVIIGKSDKMAVDEMIKNFSYSYPFPQDTVLPLKTSVTEANANLGEEIYKEITLFDEDSTDRERGNVAHKILETFDFDSPLDLKTQAEKMVEEGIITHEQLLKVDLFRIEKALNGYLIRAVKGKKLFREKGFIIQVEGRKVLGVDTDEKVLMQGVIDLLAIDDDSATIIDYKYSVHGGESLRKRYKKQLDLYAHAVEQVLSLKVENKVIVNLFTGEIVDIS